MDKSYKVSVKIGGHEMYRVCRSISEAYEKTTKLWMNEIFPLLNLEDFKLRLPSDVLNRDNLMEALVKMQNGELGSVDFNGILVSACDKT